MQSRFYSSNLFLTLWSLLCVTLAAVAFTTLLNWGNVDHDEVYQAYSVINWHEISVAPLSHFIGNMWFNKVGGSVANLRALSMLIAVASIAISCIYALIRTKNLWLSAFLFATMAWIWRTEAFILYNWDSGSMLWNTLALIAIVEYFRKPSMHKSMLCGLTFALMALGRIPSAIILPLFIILVFVQEFHKTHRFRNSLINAAACIISFTVAAWLLLTLLYGNMARYIADFQQNSISGHSLSDPSHYIWRLIFLLPYYLQENLTSVVCMLLPLIFRKRLRILLTKERLSKSDIPTIATIILLSLSAVILSVWLAKSCLGSDTQCFYGAGCALAVGLLLAIPVRNFSNPTEPKISVPYFPLWGCAILLIAAAFGSDAYFERILACYTVPVIMAILWSAHNKSLNQYCILILALALPCFISINLTHWSKLKKECTYTYNDNLSVFSGIKASRNLEKEYLELLPAINSLKADNLRYILIGDRHTMSLLFGNDAGPHMNQFHFRANKPYCWTAGYLDYLDNTDAIVYSVSDFQSDSELQQVVTLMKSHGFRNARHSGNAIILTKKAPDSIN